MSGPDVKVLTLAYDSINHYLVACRDGWLLVDAGWPGSLGRLRNALQRYGIALAAIRYVMLTHAHPDHAGLTQEVKEAAGARLLIHELQVPYLPGLAAFYQKKGGYVPIVVGAGDTVARDDGRAALQAIGIAGALVPTPGHTPDSVTLLLAGGSAFTGDLPLPGNVDEAQLAIVQTSWARLAGLGARTAYPAHAGPFLMQDMMI